MTSTPAPLIPVHECSFPAQPPRGTIVSPGPCECGKTFDQGQADQQYAQACAAVARAYPLPEADFVTAMGAGWHAARHGDAERAVARHGMDPAVITVCGRPAMLARAWPVYGGEKRPAASEQCPECAWAVAAERGDLGSQVRALAPSPAQHAVLARLLPDPLIAVNAAAMLVEAAAGGYGEYEPDHPQVIQVLAAVTRHSPVILLPEDCAEGSCEHYPDGYEPGSGLPWECPMPDASAACKACSLQAGGWAGEWEGQFLSECTIPAPCPVLTALAGHAADALEKARRGRKAQAEWEAAEAARGGAGQP